MVHGRNLLDRVVSRSKDMRKRIRERMQVIVNDMLIHHSYSGIFFGLRHQNRKTLISFRIDDVTFSKEDRDMLISALTIAKRHCIKFDLAVIAEKFDRMRDEETFKIYSENKDVFEIVAHGTTHENPSNPMHKGEFYDLTSSKRISYSIQEKKIREMVSIFSRHGIKSGTEIFVVPFFAGDNATISISREYGYKLLVQSTVPFGLIEGISGKMIISRSTVSLPTLNFSQNEIARKMKKIRKLSRFRNVQIALHPANFKDLENLETILQSIIALKEKDEKIIFDFISKRLSQV